MRRLGVRPAVRTLVVAVALVASVAGCGGGENAAAPAPSVPDLRLGMSIAEAKQTLGERFRLPSWHLSVSADCNYFDIEGASIGGLVIAKEIATVDFERELDSNGRPVGPAAASLRGLQPGQTLHHAVELFGRPDRIATAESSGGEMLTWRLGELEGKGIFLRVNTYAYPGQSAGRVGSVEIGLEPYIFYGEGCA